MPDQSDLLPAIRRQISNLIGDPACDFELSLDSLRGGTEATAIALLTARYRDKQNRQRVVKLVVKTLEGRPAREAAVYRQFISPHVAHMAPRLLGTHRIDASRVLLFIEAIRKTEAWPWRNTSTLMQAVQDLGRFHSAEHDAVSALADWDYDADLSRLAEFTLASVERCRSDPDLSPLYRHRRSIKRLILRLPNLRRQLLCERPFASRPIHGDVHPGNALIARRGGRNSFILLDWGRARWGSPLEDLSCWLQSLRLWEPAALRTHDTLVSAYLSALGMEQRLTSQIRGAYWIAGGLNALSGALLHHLHVLQNRQQKRDKHSVAFRAASDWLRIIRRADAWTS